MREICCFKLTKIQNAATYLNQSKYPCTYETLQESLIITVGLYYFNQS
ncbi:hypothetical protein pb186bvf_014802 [Paramecium bursaria]